MLRGYLRSPTQRSGWAWKIDVGGGWKMDVGGGWKMDVGGGWKISVYLS